MSDTSSDSTFLKTTDFLDWQHDDVQRFTENAVGNVHDPVQKARLIFTAVRDRIWYDPYSTDDDPEHYRASYVAAASRAFCVPKAVLLTAAARAAGIPARLGFADVRNHLQTATLRARMGGTDVFVYHGYSELRLNDRWVKATPAFNAELCARFGVPPIDFDGHSDALLHAYDGARSECERPRTGTHLTGIHRGARRMAHGGAVETLVGDMAVTRKSADASGVQTCFGHDRSQHA